MIAAATTEKISMRAARRRVQSRYVREDVSYAQTLKNKRPSSRRVATTPTTPSLVVITGLSFCPLFLIKSGALDKMDETEQNGRNWTKLDKIGQNSIYFSHSNF